MDHTYFFMVVTETIRDLPFIFRQMEGPSSVI